MGRVGGGNYIYLLGCFVCVCGVTLIFPLYISIGLCIEILTCLLLLGLDSIPWFKLSHLGQETHPHTVNPISLNLDPPSPHSSPLNPMMHIATHKQDENPLFKSDSD